MDQKIHQLKQDIQKLIQSFTEEGKTFSSVRLEPVLEGFIANDFILVVEADWFANLSDLEAIRTITSRLYGLRDQGIINSTTIRAIQAVRTEIPTQSIPLTVYP